MNSKIKMSSIARRINFDLWLKRFADVILLDMLLVALTVGGALLWCEERLSEGENVISRDFVVSDNSDEFAITIEPNGGISVQEGLEETGRAVSIQVKNRDKVIAVLNNLEKGSI